MSRLTDAELCHLPAADTRFALLVHHIDEKREWACDRKAYILKPDKGLDEAAAKGWTVVSMKDDWKTIYTFEK